MQLTVNIEHVENGEFPFKWSVESELTGDVKDGFESTESEARNRITEVVSEMLLDMKVG